MSQSTFLNLLSYFWKRNNWIFYLPRLWRRFDETPIDRPIFLLGNQGGGLTLVSRMLRRHQQVVSITGDHTYWSGADEMQKVMMCRLPPSLRLGSRFICKDPPHPTFTPPRSWSYASDDLLPYYRKTELDSNPKDARKLRSILGEALYRHGGTRPGLRFVDKSQVYSLKMSFMDALLKGTKPHFVLIIRNPYVACYRAALGRAGDMRRYARRLSLEQRIEVCAQHWANTVRCVLEDSARVEHFKAIHFEDLLQNPEASLRGLCAFLDLSFDPDMFPQPHHAMPIGSRYADRWYPLRRDVNRYYLQEITPEYSKIISHRCQALAEQLGY